MLRAREGDLDAYAELVRRHTPVAVRTAALLGAGPDAEDVVQEALVKAYRALGGFRSGAPFRPWLLRIVANESRNLHRSGARRGTREESFARSHERVGGGEVARDPAEDVARRELHGQVLDALAEVPERLRQVVVCRYLLDLDERETATVLGVPRGTVKSLLSRGLRQLRTALVAAGVEPPSPAKEGT